MPYYIAKDRPGCDGRWAVVKESGAVVKCHETKEMAVRQMVAVSVAEGIEPGGEWKKDESD
jgi:hypothetical protein